MFELLQNIDFQQINYYFQVFLDFFLRWFWLLLPFILWKPFSYLWLWWRNSAFDDTINKILLEVRIPKEVLKPMRAMETVVAGINQIMYDPPDTWEKWVEGKYQVSANLEIASIDGIPHFFLRIPDSVEDSIKSVIYAQYPDAEITRAPDYTKMVPQDIPNEEWDLWGDNYVLLNNEAYPIKTYKDFETETERLEEKKIDPMSALLEGITQTGPGEQIWLQIKMTPIEGKYWADEVRDQLAKRIKEKRVVNKLMIEQAADVLFAGVIPTGPEVIEDDTSIIPPEMKLTPGERKLLESVENKMSKTPLKTAIRFIYLGKRESFVKSRLRLVFGFFGSFTLASSNMLKPLGQPTITKIKKSFFLPINLLRRRRGYLRKRNLFKKYKRRISPFYPRPGGTFILSIEELATLFHFPGKGVTPAPFVERVETKKKRPPIDLPTE